MSNEGFRLFSIGKHKEAIEYYQQILDKDPKCLWAYRDKALNHKFLNDKPTAVGCLTQAEARNDNSAVGYACRALKLFFRGKKEEAFKIFNKAMTEDPKDVMNLSIYAYCLMLSSKYDEAIEICDQAIETDRSAVWALCIKAACLATFPRYHASKENFRLAYKIDPKFGLAYLYHGRMLSSFGEREKALECFNKCLSFNPDFFSAIHDMANIYYQQERYKEALPLQEKVVHLSNRMPATLEAYGKTLCKLGRVEEGISCFNEAIAIEPKDPLMLCVRGEAFLKLNKLSNAARDFTNASILVECGELGEETSKSNLKFVKGDVLLVDFGELQEMAKETERDVEERIGELQRNQNSQAKNIKETLEKLRQQKDEMTTKFIRNFESRDPKITPSTNEEMQALKQQYLDLQSHARSSTTKVRVATTEARMEEIQTELNNNLDNYNRRLDTALQSQNTSPDAIIKVKDYFKAFVGTFSSLYVTSQIVNSGHVQLDADSTKATILSAAISFAPLVGNFPSNAIKSIPAFLESKEMKQSVKKMGRLAGDSTELSQLVGGAAYQIVTDPTKKNKILTITAEDMKSQFTSSAKILKFCQNIGQEADASLYGKLYETPSAQLGHNDANQIIKEWLGLQCGFDNVQKAFVQIIVKSSPQQSPAFILPSSGILSGPVAKKPGCCNIF